MRPSIKSFARCRNFADGKKENFGTGRQIAWIGQPSQKPNLLILVGITAFILFQNASLTADVLYVNNRIGSDKFDGTAEKPISKVTGPVKTVQQAVEIARPADTIVLTDTGYPYYGSIQLVGSRHSGTDAGPLTIIGNGGTLSGARRVPTWAWKEVERNLWKFTPWRKGHYQLLLENQPLPEHKIPKSNLERPEIPVQHWAAWKGSIYYQAQPLERPPEKPFAFAARAAGLTLYNVSNVRIVDLTFRHFRLDGIHAHDLCRNIILEKVRAVENGRAGLFAGGTSRLTVRNSQFQGNRVHQLLTGKHTTVDLQQTEFGEQSTAQKQEDEKNEVSQTTGVSSTSNAEE